MSNTFDLAVIPDTHADDDESGEAQDELCSRPWNMAGAEDEEEIGNVFCYPWSAPSALMMKAFAEVLRAHHARDDYNGLGCWSVYDATTTWVLYCTGEERVEWWTWQGPGPGNCEHWDFKDLVEYWQPTAWDYLTVLWWDGRVMHEVPRANSRPELPQLVQ